jgi:hypothetical protein
MMGAKVVRPFVAAKLAQSTIRCAHLLRHAPSVSLFVRCDDSPPLRRTQFFV